MLHQEAVAAQGAVAELRAGGDVVEQDDLGMSQRYDASAKAAREIGVVVQPLGVREPDDFNEAFAAMTREMPDAILMVSDALGGAQSQAGHHFAAESSRAGDIRRITSPVTAVLCPMARTSAKRSRAAALVDRIFKGEKPADLPFEQPTRLFGDQFEDRQGDGSQRSDNNVALADEVIE